MDSIVNNSEMNKIATTETANKVSKKIKNKSDDQINDSRDSNTTEVVGYGKGETDPNVQLQMQLQLENSLNMIDDIKKIISEFEQNYLKISRIAPEIDLASLMRNFDNQKFQEYASHNKCTPESNSQKPARSEITRKQDGKVDSKNPGNVSELRALVKNCKSAINNLEKKLEDRTEKKYLSESPTESEDEKSDDSVYDPRNAAFSKNASRKRRQSNKVTKVGKKLRGRPRKHFVDDQSSNSSPEIREKKIRGRPRKTVVDDDDDEDEKSSLSNNEPKAKKSRGRPRKNKVEDDTSSSVKESNDNVKQESDSLDSKEKDSSNDKNAGDSTEISEKQKNEVTEKRQKGRPKKNTETDKKRRGRPKSNLVSETHKDATETANNDSFLVKSRGRPKKNKIVEDEPSNSTSN